MKRVLALLALFTLALAQSELQFLGQLETEFRLRYADLSQSEPATRFRLRLETGADYADLSVELRADARGVRLGEAYAQAYLGPVDLMLGRILLTTGRTDLYSPLDAFNPRDYSYPLAPPEEQKVPVEGAWLVYYPTDARASVELYYAPRFVPSTPPEGIWARPNPLPPGVVKVETARPGPLLENGVFGVRGLYSFDVLEGLDVNALLLYTYTPFPGLKALLDASDPSRPCPDPSTGPCIAVLGYDRLTLVGGDLTFGFSLPEIEGGFIARIEAALGLTGDLEGQNPLVQDSYFEGVLELEHPFPDGPTVLLLYHGRYAKAPGWTHHLALSAYYEANESLTLEGAWVQNLSDGSGVLLPRVRYRLAEGLEARASLSFLYGKGTSEFGVWRDNGELSLGLRYVF